MPLVLARSAKNLRQTPSTDHSHKPLCFLALVLARSTKSLRRTRQPIIRINRCVSWPLYWSFRRTAYVGPLTQTTLLRRWSRDSVFGLVRPRGHPITKSSLKSIHLFTARPQNVHYNSINRLPRNKFACRACCSVVPVLVEKSVHCSRRCMLLFCMGPLLC